MVSPGHSAPIDCWTSPVSARNWSMMIERIQVIGDGRVGSAVRARLAERGFAQDPVRPELVLLCVPDRAIPSVARAVEPGPWIAHVSGATPLSALDPHTRRFGFHPLQTFTLRRGPEQLDGAFAAVTAESDRARELGSGLPGSWAPSHSSSTTSAAPPTTQVLQSRPITSSRCDARPALCSKLRAHQPRHSTRSCAARSRTSSS